VLIVRTACCSRNVLCFTGLGPTTGAHREDCLLFRKRAMFYWSWAGGLVLIVKTICCSRNVLCFTGLGPRTGAHREDCLLF
jgi:hypothetical protein